MRENRIKDLTDKRRDGKMMVGGHEAHRGVTEMVIISPNGKYALTPIKAEALKVAKNHPPSIPV